MLREGAEALLLRGQGGRASRDLQSIDCIDTSSQCTHVYPLQALLTVTAATVGATHAWTLPD